MIGGRIEWKYVPEIEYRKVLMYGCAYCWTNVLGSCRFQRTSTCMQRRNITTYLHCLKLTSVNNVQSSFRERIPCVSACVACEKPYEI